MLGFSDYFWRLLPANPILLRVVETGGKRKRDLFIRCGYLGLLITLVIFSLITSNNSISGTSLADLAKESGNIFQGMSYLQLGLVALLAPIFTAGAITQEKDNQTYDILLATPLTNAQIVLGSLMSRLFFVIALLVSGIPIFSITQIFGGVAIRSIILSFLIAAATAIVTGALAMAIATFKVGTRRTIFSFYMFVVIYLVGTFLLDRLDFFHVRLLDPQTGGVSSDLSSTSWLTALNPFLALRAIFHDRSYLPPAVARLPESLRDWPFGWMLSSPTSFYISLMFSLSLILVLPSAILLRRMAQSTVSPKAWVLQKLHVATADRRRKPRGVWNNPIAWREAKTKASAARASFLRYGFIIAGLVGALAMVVMFAQKKDIQQFITPGSYNAADQTIYITGGQGAGTYAVDPNITKITLNGKDASLPALSDKYVVKSPPAVQLYGKKRILVSLDLADVPRTLSAKEARSYLLGAVLLEFAVILLIVTNTAASTVTREKEDGTLDLLLSTPITSRYYIWGKLRGLVSFMLPLVAIPIASILMFVIYDFLRLLGGSGSQSFEWIVFPESVLILPGMMIIVVAFASIMGMQMSLKLRTTVRAVMGSVGIVLGICGALSWCGYQFITTRAGENIGLVFAAFSPFTLITILLDPYNYGGRMFANGADPSEIMTARIIVLVFSWIATAGYAAAVWALYKSMVKNFDMTIRKQSR
jgi:ABC-type transport system involved in multi-copper enzyme maturation permease subunit